VAIIIIIVVTMLGVRGIAEHSTRKYMYM